ncbi:ComEA family DNA-binding protein [Streptomyces pini]|uniref:Competence protein ComEA n=1 Tax=Streptomyces pini TaxID=1520580 RepID=A0A1I3YTF3_9ACTN|nr:ComEA family DNA-binding protein [Streptomyces pini]SFK35040.1 competence protein ComEA [Streptomyces pini]
MTEPDAVPGPGPGPGPVDVTRRARLAEAVRDRLPLWVRTRCGVEPRTLAALALALAVALGFAVHHFWSGRPQTVQAPPVESASRSSPGPSPLSSPAPSTAPAPAAASGTASGAALGGGPLLVDVAGEVRRPGVHRLPAGARVADALRAAGGVRPGTDLHGLNRARPLADGEQIVVGEPPTAAAVPGPPAAPAAGGGPAAGGPVSLNAATAEQLDTLPGIGPVMARRIIDHRTERGGFSSVEELREVSGIGERRFAELKPLVGP